MASRDRVTSILWAWNDLVWTLFAAILIVAFLIASQKKPETPTETDRSAGDISITIFWPDGDTDIDTWLRSPDGDVVSFTHKSGTTWSLLRDDLGVPNDRTPHNFENAYSRGAPPGEYSVNVNVYRNYAAFPVQIDAELRIRPNPKSSAVVFNARVMLDRVGDEVTLWRFSIDNDGNLVPGSVNNLFSPLAKEEK